MNGITEQVMTNIHTEGNLILSDSSHVTIIGGSIGGSVVAKGTKHLTMIGVRLGGGFYMQASEGHGVYHVSLTGVHVGFNGAGPDVGFLFETSDRVDYRRSNHITLQGCTARWCKTGYKFSRCSGVSMLGCLAEAGEIGVSVDDCESLSIHGGHFETNKKCDIWIGKGSYRTKEFGAFLGSPKKFDGPNVEATGNDLSVWRHQLKVQSIDASGHVWGKSFNVQKPPSVEVPR